jgi:hypothetical protein
MKKKAPTQPIQLPEFKTRQKQVDALKAKVNKGIQNKMWKYVREV